MAIRFALAEYDMLLRRFNVVFVPFVVFGFIKHPLIKSNH
jgi:hypothetical protein